MSITFRLGPFIWAVFIWFGSGVAGGPGFSAPKPWIEIIGFLLLALINFEKIGKRYAYLLIIIVILSVLYRAYLLLQYPHFPWGGLLGCLIPIGILLFSAYSIWKSRPENNNALDDAEEDKKSN